MFGILKISRQEKLSEWDVRAFYQFLDRLITFAAQDNSEVRTAAVKQFLAAISEENLASPEKKALKSAVQLTIYTLNAKEGVVPAKAENGVYLTGQGNGFAFELISARSA